jgi:hypothetical protein
MHVMNMSKGQWKTEIKDVARAEVRAVDSSNRLCILDMHDFLVEHHEYVGAEAIELAWCTMRERSD